MSNENTGVEYIKILADIIESEMNLAPANPASTNPNDRRVFLYNQDFVVPTYDDMFIILSESPGKVISVRTRPADETLGINEVQELIMQREIGIDIVSKNHESRQRKEEVLLALASTYSLQQQEKAGFRIFAYSLSFVDVSENEGAARLTRYRASVLLHVRYSKTKAIDYYSAFPYNAMYN